MVIFSAYFVEFLVLGFKQGALLLIAFVSECYFL